MCNSKQLCDNLECKICFEKSFASHEKSKYWSDKNDCVKPRQVFKSSNNKYWFKCNTCCHDFESILCNITGKKTTTWCPYCSNPSKQLCNKLNCQSCYKKSFASHEKSKYWSDKNGDVKPIQVFKSSGNKYWFDCNCGHQFNIRLADINGIQASWCSYCANRKLCDNEECKPALTIHLLHMKNQNIGVRIMVI